MGDSAQNKQTNHSVCRKLGGGRGREKNSRGREEEEQGRGTTALLWLDKEDLTGV